MHHARRHTAKNLIVHRWIMPQKLS
jgi:hypothetical protein